MGISAPITFTVATECKDGKTYQLVTKEVDTKIENVEKIKVDSNDILVQVQNVKESEKGKYEIKKPLMLEISLKNSENEIKLIAFNDLVLSRSAVLSSF